jgi:hypothetical protein
MHYLPGILALLIGAAGWHYLFYSPAARRLGAIEHPAVNLKRSRLRRANGVALLMLAGLFYAGFYAVDDRQTPQTFVLVWLGVFVLLFIVVVLAVIDLRLTAKLRRK